jgi:hypothetical protein
MKNPQKTVHRFMGGYKGSPTAGTLYVPAVQETFQDATDLRRTIHSS